MTCRASQNGFGGTDLVVQKEISRPQWKQGGLGEIMPVWHKKLTDVLQTLAPTGMTCFAVIRIDLKMR